MKNKRTNDKWKNEKILKELDRGWSPKSRLWMQPVFMRIKTMERIYHELRKLANS